MMCKHKVLVASFLLLTCFTTSTQAVIIEVTFSDPEERRLDVLMTEIGSIDGRVYTLDLEAGEVKFVDGQQGARPPTGQNNVVGSYRYGDDDTDGAIINIYPIQPGNLLPLIPVTDFIDTNNNEDLSFIIVGLASLEFKFYPDRGLLITDAQIRTTGIPEPTTLALMGLGLAGIGYKRYRSKKAA